MNMVAQISTSADLVRDVSAVQGRIGLLTLAPRLLTLTLRGRLLAGLAGQCLARVLPEPESPDAGGAAVPEPRAALTLLLNPSPEVSCAVASSSLHACDRLDSEMLS